MIQKETRVLVLCKAGNLSESEMALLIQYQASTLLCALDIVVVVIDRMTRCNLYGHPQKSELKKAAPHEPLVICIRHSVPQIRMLCRGIIVQVGPEPALDLDYAHSLALVIVGHLVAVDFTQAEIA